MAKDYVGDGIVVEWRPERCVHTGRCLAALPDVFDTGRRPWIELRGADAVAVARAVDGCPSGALRWRRPEEPAPRVPTEAPVVIRPFPNGPLVLRGPARIETWDGEVITVEDRVTLCRCGATGNQPFCDNSHRRVGFQDHVPMVAPAREAADSPEGCGPPQDA